MPQESDDGWLVGWQYEVRMRGSLGSDLWNGFDVLLGRRPE